MIDMAPPQFHNRPMKPSGRARLYYKSHISALAVSAFAIAFASSALIWFFWCIIIYPRINIGGLRTQQEIESSYELTESHLPAEVRAERKAERLAEAKRGELVRNRNGLITTNIGIYVCVLLVTPAMFVLLESLRSSTGRKRRGCERRCPSR